MSPSNPNLPSPGHFGDRVLAWVIDWVPLAGLTGVLVSIDLQWLWLLLPAHWAYHVISLASEKRATPGKQVMHLQVVDANGQALGIGRASLRWVAGGVSWALLGLGFLLARANPRGQAMHDLLADTEVRSTRVAAAATIDLARPWGVWHWAGFLFAAVAAMYSIVIAIAAIPVYHNYRTRAGFDALFEATRPALRVAEKAMDKAQCADGIRHASHAWMQAITVGGNFPDCWVEVKLNFHPDMPEDAWGGHLLWTADLSSYPSPGALRCEADFSVIGLSEHCNGNP
ncbi:MAG: RDD family protein [Aquimonas sp.]|nr:RDD family protein [Xanthomonadales bacterium]MCC6505304.1 RDD family protein [Aquimonas sp.]